MELHKIDLRDFWISDVSDSECRFGGKVEFEFYEGQKVSRVEVSHGITLPNSTAIADARRAMIASACDLLAVAATISPEKIEKSIAKWHRWDVGTSDQSLIASD